MNDKQIAEWRAVAIRVAEALATLPLDCLGISSGPGKIPEYVRDDLILALEKASHDRS